MIQINNFQGAIYMAIYLRAYGGTGGLIARAFIAMMVTNPIKGNPEINVTRMDLDIDADDNQTTDYTYIDNLIDAYNNLHNMGMECIASSKIINNNTGASLREIRDHSFGVDDGNPNYSIQDAFINDDNEIKKLMLSALSNEQIESSNYDGAYGDLARNAFIAYPLTLKDGFASFVDFDKMNTQGNKVFYIGSTDGGTANTLMDPEIKSFCEYIKNNNKKRNAEIYGVRTLPYKTHSINSEKKEVKKDAERIARDMVAQSAGVLKNIITNDKNSSHYNYYRKSVARTQNDDNSSEKTPKDRYWLDGLMLIGYDVNSSADFDNTNYDKNKAATSQQYHKSHITELGAAMMIIDAANDKVKTSAGTDPVYGYLVEENNKHKITAEKFLPDYGFDSFMMKPDNKDKYIPISVKERVRLCVHLYAFVKLHMVKHFSEEVTKGKLRHAEKYVRLLNDSIGLLKDPLKHNFMEGIHTKLLDFIKNMKYFLEMLYNVQEESRFGGTTKVCIVDNDALKLFVEDNEEELQKYAYSHDGIIGARDATDDANNISTDLANWYKDELRKIYKKDTADDGAKAASKVLDLLYQVIYEELQKE